MYLDQIEKLVDVIQFLVGQITDEEAASLDRSVLSDCNDKLSDLLRNLDESNVRE